MFLHGENEKGSGSFFRPFGKRCLTPLPTTNRRRGRLRYAAFTLIELLLAMSMVAVLAASLYGTLQVGFRAREHAEASLAPVRAAGIALDLMAADLRGAPPPKGILAGVFNGADAKDGSVQYDADMVNFFTRAMNSLDAAPGIVQVEYALVPDADKGNASLVRRVAVNLLSPEQPTAVEETVCSGVLALNLRYYDGASWQDTWDSTQHADALPNLVEIGMDVAAAPDRNGDPQSYAFRRVVSLPCRPPPEADAGATTAQPAASQKQAN